MTSPQCQPSAILHLCRTCKVTTLFIDRTFQDLAEAIRGLVKSPKVEWKIHISTLVSIEDDRDNDDAKARYQRRYSSKQIESWRCSENDVAYIHHTSGTSTGLPKPIPQTHRAAVGVLPTFANSYDKATFTTTPLYHGGVADCFRAWTSAAMIWLFPGADAPITASNVLKALGCTRKSTEMYGTPSVTYFSSVPYVLQMLAGEDKGLAMLKEMDLVGVGGAALPQNMGDELVNQGVNLVSRFGSAECGFLMSSHRDYANDKEWQYLRSDASPFLKFKPQDDGLAELVILSTWPHMAKRNRDDGSYATADLFAPHPNIANAWKYHSRADSQLALITGKKFDPAPLEAVIGTSPLVSDVLIFGNSQQYPGALLFRSNQSTNMTSEEVLTAVWPLVEKLNAESQGHARLSRSMLTVMPNDSQGLEKSSKGTTMRGEAEKKYAEIIMLAYEGGSKLPTDVLPNGDPAAIVPDEDVPATILKIIKNVKNSEDTITEDADLFSCGVDSVACMQIRAQLQGKLVPAHAASLPLNVVYDCGTIQKLSKYLIRLRKGQTIDGEDEIQLMHELVKEHGSFIDVSRSAEAIENPHPYVISQKPNGHTVVLTGATGALGAHILSLLRSSNHVSQIHCLVRAASQTAAIERVSKSLLARNKPALGSTSKIQCHPCKLSSPTLGLLESDYQSLATEVTVVIHAAWAVNFSMRLSSFVKDHINGIRNLINFALASPHARAPRFIFCSSTASVLGPHKTSPILESISHDPLTASPLGYSRSKWVAEAICEKAHSNTRMRDHIAVLQVGQLCGDTENGIWNATEAWPLMLSSVKITKSLPDLKDEKLSWLPVDVAAEAVLEIAFSGSDKSPARKALHVPVYHILNPSKEPTWFDLLRWLQKLSPCFDVVSPADWVSRLENLKGEETKHPATKLLGLWREAYCTDDGKQDGTEDVVFAMEATKRAAPTMRDVKPVDEEQFDKIWRWIKREMM